MSFRTQPSCYAGTGVNNLVQSRRSTSLSVLSALSKDFALEKPALTASVAENAGKYEIVLSTDVFSKGVALARDDCVFRTTFRPVLRREERRIAVPKGESPTTRGSYKSHADVLMRALG